MCALVPSPLNVVDLKHETWWERWKENAAAWALGLSCKELGNPDLAKLNDSLYSNTVLPSERRETAGHFILRKRYH